MPMKIVSNINRLLLNYELCLLLNLNKISYELVLRIAGSESHGSSVELYLSDTS